MDNTQNKSQSFQRVPSNPFVPRPSYTSANKFNIPEKKPSDDIINKLFLTVAEGNFLKIKDFLLSNQVSMTAKNDIGESVLHIIIKNSNPNITKREKLELIQLAIDKGANVAAFDQTNITPLHLASKYGLYDIVKLLLKYSANPRAVDNQFKTPLHYAIVGEATICPNTGREKVKELIQENTKKYGKKEKNDLMLELHKYINDFLFVDKSTQQYIQHIKNTIQNMGDMYPFAIKNKIDVNKQIIVDVIINGTLSENDKKKIIFDKLIESQREINDYLQQKVETATNSLIINPGALMGWGPDSREENRIMPFRSILEIAKPINISLETQKKGIILSLNKNFEYINNIMKNIITFSKNCSNIIIDTLTSLQTINNNPDPLYFFESNPLEKVVTPNLLEHIIIDPINYAETSPPILLISGNNNTAGIYFNTKFKIFNRLLQKEIINMANILNNMYDLVQKEISYDQIYKIHTSNFVISCLNCALLLGNLDDELEKINKRFSYIRDYLDGLNLNIDKVTKIIIDCNEIGKRINSMYDVMKNNINTFNDLISYIERKSSYKCIIAYFDGSDTFTDFYINPDISIFTEVFANPIQKIREFPGTLSEFQKLRSDIYQTKKILIEDFIPQITIMNSPSYIKTPATPAPDILPTIGYLVSSNNITIINQSNTSQTWLPEIKEIGVSPLLYPPNPTHIGNIGYINSKKYKKSDKLPLIIGQYLEIHLDMIKQSIIKWLIMQIYVYLSQSTVTQQTTTTTIKDILIKLNTEMNKMVSFGQGNYGHILTLVARYADKIITNFIYGLVSHQTNTILMKALEKTNLPKHYTEIFNNTPNNIIIPASDIGLKLDLNEIFPELEIMYQQKLDNDLRKKIMAMSTGNIHEDHNKSNTIHKLLNFNYNINSLEQSCFKYDIDIIKLLIDSNISINAKDNLGNTALYYAVEMKNTDLVQLLLNNGSAIDTISKNKLGKTVLESAWDEYVRIIQQNDQNKYDICNSITNTVLDEFKKKDYKNNIPRYSKILLPMVLYLINHQFYITGKGYPNKWTYEQNVELENFMKTNFNDPLPLLQIKMSTSDIAEEYNGNMIKYHNVEIEEYNKKIQNLEHQNRNLDEEAKSMISKNIRKNEINDIITKNAINIAKYKNNVRRITKKINKLKSSNNINFSGLAKFLDLNKKKLEQKGNSVNIYESVFINVINNEYVNLLKNDLYNYKIDFKTYPNLWNKYFNSPDKNDHTQIIDRIIDYQKEIINDTNPIHEKCKKLNIINNYYDNVIIPFIDNYFDMPREYKGSNYAMDLIIDILVHIVKRVIMVNLFSTIVKILIKYVINTFPKTNKSDIFTNDIEYQKYITNIILNIIDDTGINNGNVSDKGSRLMGYIFEILPLKIVKIILKIFEGYDEGIDDIDRETKIDVLFDHINKIIGSTTVIDITPDSSLLNSLRENVYPFYREYLELFVSKMKSLLDNYMRSLKYQSLSLQMLSKLC